MKTHIIRSTWPRWTYPLLLWLAFLSVLLLLRYWALQQQFPLLWLDPAIAQLLCLALLAYFGGLNLSIGLLRYVIRSSALPAVPSLLLQFRSLPLGQQFWLYLAAFALLFFGLLLSLAAIF